MSDLIKVLDYECKEFVANGNVLQRRDYGIRVTWRIWRNDRWEPITKKHQDKLEQAYQTEYNGRKR